MLSRWGHFLLVGSGLLSCSPGMLGQDDGFRQRIPTACTTKNQCAELVSEAIRRTQDCSTNTIGKVRCSDAGTDLRRVQDLRRDFLREYEAANEKEIEAMQQRRRQEIDAFRVEQDRLSKAKAEEERRKSEADVIIGKIERATKSKLDLSSADDPDIAKSDFAAVRALMADLQKIDIERAQKLSPEVDDLERRVEAAIQSEKQCRETPSCILPRLARPTCAAIERRRAAAAAMAHEQKNPSGYVDRRVLHGFGQEIQDADDVIKHEKEAFAKSAKRSFSENLCRK